MRLDRTYSDVKDAIKRILHALDNNVTVQENFGPSGAPAGQTIVSRGPARVPVWGTPTVQVAPGEGSSASGGGTVGVVVVEGPQGPPGPPGTDCDCTTSECACEPLIDGDDGSLVLFEDAFGNFDIAMVLTEAV